MPASDPRLERLFRDHHAALLAYARRRSPHAAEDVVSEVFAVAVRRNDVVPDDPSAERAWLFGVAKHVLQDQYRRDQRAAAIVDHLAPYAQAETPGSEPTAIGAALNTLPPVERAVLTMTGLGGLTSAEAAGELGLAPGSARNVMTRGRRNLALQLAALGALTVIGVVFALVDRAERRTTSLKTLARQITQSPRVEAAATVTSRGRSATYEVFVDRARNRQRFGIGDGVSLTGPVGGTLRTVAPASQPSSAVKRRVAESADAVRALRTFTEGQAAGLLRAAARGDADIVRVGDRNRIEGIVALAGAQRARLAVDVSRDSSRLYGLRLRAEGRTTTVQFGRVELNGSGPAPTLPPASSPRPAPAPAPQTARAQRSNDPSTVTAREARENRKRVAALPTYTGGVGGVRYVKTLERDARGPATRARETWWERDGGSRWHQRTYRVERGGRLVPVRDVWLTKTMKVVRPWRRDGSSGGFTVTIACGAEQAAAQWSEAERAAEPPRIRRMKQRARGRILRDRQTITGLLPLPSTGTVTDPAWPGWSIRGWYSVNTNLAMRIIETRPAANGEPARYRQVDYLRNRMMSVPESDLAAPLPKRYKLREQRCDTAPASTPGFAASDTNTPPQTTP